MRLTLEWGVASDAVMREGWKKGRGGRERESERYRRLVRGGCFKLKSKWVFQKVYQMKLLDP